MMVRERRRINSEDAERMHSEIGDGQILVGNVQTSD